MDVPKDIPLELIHPELLDPPLVPGLRQSPVLDHIEDLASIVGLLNCPIHGVGPCLSNSLG